MNEIVDEIKSGGINGEEQQQTSAEIIVDGESVSTTPMVGVRQKQPESPGHSKDNDENKEKDADPPPTDDDETLNTLKLLGDPLASQGPYTFYSALAYRKHSDVIKKKRRRWKNQKLQNVGDDENATSAKSCDSSSLCDCNDDSGNNLCTCDDTSLSFSLSPSNSEWSVVRMNHFYAVRPWYSIRNSSTSDRQQKLQSQRRQRKNSPKLATSTSVERRQHHYQQSVCIGELELLWRDDSVATTTVVSSSSLKKRNSNKAALSSQTAVSNGTDAMPNSSSHGVNTAVSSDEDDGLGGNDDDSSSLLPRRRTLPRRTRQPSAKKLEAAESYAAAAAAAAPDHHPLQQSSYHRSRLSTSVLTDSTSVGVPLSSPSAQYRHGNVLCSVRLYVMPDQTAAGRLGGVHGEDEVLEINTWGSSGGGDRWSSNAFINGGNGVGSIYNGGGAGVDDYGYGSGSHSSGTLPSGCSGLVLRAEDFVEWVRGGLMNDDEYEDTESDAESLESECGNNLPDQNLIKTEISKKEETQQPLPITTDGSDKVKQLERVKLESLNHDENNKVKTQDEGPTIDDVVKKENSMTENLKETEKVKVSSVMLMNPVKVKEEQCTIDLDKNDSSTILKEKDNDNQKSFYSKSFIEEALEAENVPLAAARIHPTQYDITHHHPNSDSLVNGDGSLTVTLKHDRLHDETTTVNKVNDISDDKQKCSSCKRRRRIYQYNNKKSKNFSSSGNEQRLIVMSYSRYCRYRAQLQRKREEQLKVIDPTVVQDGDNGTAVIPTNQGVDKINSTRVLFCRDTYDYPAELLLEPFNAQHGQQQNTSVLVNHMAPKLKGWPAYPASWMSFRWNRVRRRLRHLEHGNSGNEDRRRRRRRKLKKKHRQRQNGVTGVTMVMSYSSSTDDDDSDDSDSDEASSATNDGATNTTSSTSTSDSDGAPPVSSVISKTSNKNQSIVTTKVNGGVHHNNKKTLSAAAASNMIIINGSTDPSNTVNKRSAAAAGQTGQQQSTKRRRVVYAIGGQPQNQQTQQQRQRIIYQQQHSKPRQLLQQQQFNQRSRQSEQFNQLSQAQRNHHMLIQQQQKRLQSLNRRLPTPISSIQSSSTRVIHHHLPPSVTIMPIIVPSKSTNAHQQQQCNSNRLPNRQKQYSPATISASQRPNNNSNRQSNSLPPVIIEYDNDDNQEYGSDDNGRYTNTTMAAAIAACHRRAERQNYEDEQKQQREEEERQRRWLVDALRLGGLEVTAVPLKSNTSGGKSSDGREMSSAAAMTSQQQRRQRQLRQRGVSIESIPVDKDHKNSGVIIQNERGDEDSNLDSDSDSVVMTVTPDVICILNKSQQQMQQESPEDNSSSTSSGPKAHFQPQQRRSINTSNNNSSRQQQPKTVTAEAGAVLHDKINRAIDSLKQQQQQSPKTDVPVSSNSKNVLVLGGFSHQYSNINNKQQQRLTKNSGVVGFRQQQTSSITDRSVKKLGLSNATITTTAKQLKHLSQSSSMNQSPFSSIAITGSPTAAANLEITLVPVTASSNTSSTKHVPQLQQKRNSSLAVPNNLVGGSEILPIPCSSSSMSVKQLQRRSAVGTSISSTSMIDNSNKSRHQQQRFSSGMSVTAKASSQQQQQQMLIMATPTVVGSQNQQQLQIDKRKPQQNKKD